MNEYEEWLRRFSYNPMPREPREPFSFRGVKYGRRSEPRARPRPTKARR